MHITGVRVALGVCKLYKFDQHLHIIGVHVFLRAGKLYKLDQHLHIVGSETCFVIALLCSGFSHGVAAEVPEAGAERRGQVCHHVLGEDLHSFALQTVTLHKCLTAHDGCSTSIGSGPSHAHCDGVTQHCFGGDRVDVWGLLEGSEWVVLSLFTILVCNFGQLLNCYLQKW